MLRARAHGGQALDALAPEVFALTREACARTLGLRLFDVQMMAGLALHEGRLAQLATGEGKTLVAVPPALLHALGGRGTHILTANDYLAARDAAWMGPAYAFFGLSAAAIAQDTPPADRRRAYAADVTYVTAKEVGFDFLRDHTALDRANLVQRPYHFAIVDEADFLLIDEARVPLVIAGAAETPPVPHARLAELARRLSPGIDVQIDEHQRNVSLTDAGLERCEDALQTRSLHTSDQPLLLSAIHVALHAEHLLKRDRDYLVRDGRVELVDEFTGRVADNRRWPHGIQPAVEAKEGVAVRPEGTILGSMPVQHLIRQWPKVAGMTATAVPSADEFDDFYQLKTVVFPSNRPCRRVDEPDLVFTHRAAKTAALVAEIVTVHATGQPILVGTASVRESEDLGRLLADRGVPHQVLNARHDAQEAALVARAGMPGAVTISTNMAGRGTDIVLGGPDAALHAEVAARGGLYVIGTNRHESRRIDDQLRGRAGRQGDPGRSRFFISLEDDLIARYGVVGLIPERRRPAPQPDPVQDPVVRREIARAQRIIEGQNFEIRKTLWRYSAMVEEQRLQMCERREDLLQDLAGTSVCRTAASDHHAALVAAVGAEAVADAERQVTLVLLDRAWSRHLAHIEDIREGIHLQRYAGLNPLTEFQRQVVGAYAAMMEGLRDDVVATFRRLEPEDGRLDLDRLGIRGPAATWTYLINDDPFSSFALSLLALGNRGLAASMGMLAVLYWPITAAVAVATFLRRRRQRRSAH